MKKCLFPIIALFALLMVQCTGDKRPRTVERPTYGLQNSKTLEIDKVILTDSATILHIDAYFRPNNWIRIDSATYIQANGEKYLIQSSENIVLHDLHWMPESGEDHFALIFPALPKGTKSIDFIESDCDDCFKIWDIDLTGKSPQYTSQLPSDVMDLRVDEKAELPEPLFKIGTTKVKVSLRGLEDGYIPRVELQYSNLATQSVESAKLSGVEGNTYYFTFDQYATGNATLLVNGRLIRFLVEPGEEVDVFFDAAAYSRFDSRYHPEPNRIYAGFRGKFAQINNELLRQANKDLMEISFFEKDTDILDVNPDEYVDKLMEVYKKKLDSLNQFGLSASMKKYTSIRYTVSLLDNVLSKPYRYERAYREKNKLDYSDPIEYETPKVTDADLKKLSSIAINDPYNIYVYPYIHIAAHLASIYSEEQINEISGSTSGLLQDIRKSSQALKLAAAMEDLTPEVKASLESVSNPFFKEVYTFLADKTIAEYKAAQEKGGFEIIKTPDVKPEKIIEAIVEQYKGQIVFVDYWATWCGPCLQGMKTIKPIKPEMKDLGVVSVYVSNPSSPKSKWMAMLPEIGGLHYYLSESEWRAVCDKYQIRGIPTYMLFDKNGRKVYEAVGFPGNEKILEEIKKLK